MMEIHHKYQIKPIVVPQGQVFMLQGPGVEEKHTDYKTARGWRDTLNTVYTHGYAEGVGGGLDADFQKVLVESMNLLDEIGEAFIENDTKAHGEAIKKQAEKIRTMLRERGVLS